MRRKQKAATTETKYSLLQEDITKGLSEEVAFKLRCVRKKAVLRGVWRERSGPTEQHVQKS